jgi:hypothetical protein
MFKRHRNIDIKNISYFGYYLQMSYQLKKKIIK